MRKPYYGIMFMALVPISLGMVLLGRALIYPEALPLKPSGAAFPQIVRYPEEAVVVYYHERRPYYVTTRRQVHGLIADRVNWVFKEAGIPYEWHKTPAKRELEMIRGNEQRACAVGWFKTPEREAFARFTLPIYLGTPTMAIARSDNGQVHSGRPLAEILTNRRLRLLRKDGYSYGTFIDDQLKRYTPREVVTTADNLGMIKMIHAHRADFLFIAREEAEDLILCSDLPIDDFRIIHFNDMPPGNKRYLICSRQVDEMTLLRLNRAIKSYLLASMAANPLAVRPTP